MSGKAYANRKKKEDRPRGDFYATPKSLVWKLIEEYPIDYGARICDPCCGDGAIVDALQEDRRVQSEVVGSDLYGDPEVDIFDIPEESYDIIITNFPFSQWDDMVRRGLEIAPVVITIGRLNYFGTHARNVSGLWKYLTDVMVFDRMVDYRTPARSDGAFHVGALVTGWFVFDREGGFRTSNSPRISILDVQEYATLGGYKGD